MKALGEEEDYRGPVVQPKFLQFESIRSNNSVKGELKNCMGLIERVDGVVGRDWIYWGGRRRDVSAQRGRRDISLLVVGRRSSWTWMR